MLLGEILDVIPREEAGTGPCEGSGGGDSLSVIVKKFQLEAGRSIGASLGRRRGLARHPKILVVYFLSGLGVCVLGVAYFTALHGKPRPVGAWNSDSRPESLAVAASIEAGEEAEPARSSLAAGPAEPDTGNESTIVEAALEDRSAIESKAVENLRSAIEASVFGRMDPSAILDAAMLCADLDFDPNSGPELSPSDRVVFPLTGAPEGLTATLQVGTPRNPKYAKALALDMRLQADSSPLVLDGVRREAPSARVEFWTDPEGRVQDVVISTHMRPDHNAARAMGIDVRSGTFVDGLKYHVDPDGMESMTFFGMRDGRLGTWETPVALDGRTWPRLANLSEFTNRMIASHESLQITKAK